MASTVIDRIDGLSTSVALKAPVRAATTANITLSGLQTIDGVSLADGDRVLVKDQSNATENGIYVARVSAWERTKDFDGARDAVNGTVVLVRSGSENADQSFRLTTANPVAFGASSITWERIAFGSRVRDKTVVSSASALQALTSDESSETADVLGYTAVGDGGGGLYYADSNDTTTSNETLDSDGRWTLVDQSGRRWKLQTPNGELDLRQIGAVPDGSSDVSDALDIAIASNARRIVCGGGTGIVCDSDVVLDGVTDKEFDFGGLPVDAKFVITGNTGRITIRNARFATSRGLSHFIRVLPDAGETIKSLTFRDLVMDLSGLTAGETLPRGIWLYPLTATSRIEKVTFESLNIYGGNASETRLDGVSVGWNNGGSGTLGYTSDSIGVVEDVTVDNCFIHDMIAGTTTALAIGKPGDPWVEYTGDGSEDTFAYPFPIVSDEGINVYLNGTLQAPTEYNVTGARADEGGTVVFNSPPSNGATVRLARLPAAVRENQHDGDGSETVFAYTFMLRSTDDLDVFVNNTLIDPNDYTVAGVDNPAGGTVTFNSPPPAPSGGQPNVHLRSAPATIALDRVRSIKISGCTIRDIDASTAALGINAQGALMTISRNTVERIGKSLGTATADCIGLYTKAWIGDISGNTLRSAGRQAYCMAKGSGEKSGATKIRGNLIIAEGADFEDTSACDIGIGAYTRGSIDIQGNRIESLGENAAIRLGIALGRSETNGNRVIEALVENNQIVQCGTGVGFFQAGRAVILPEKVRIKSNTFARNGSDLSLDLRAYTPSELTLHGNDTDLVSGAAARSKLVIDSNVPTTGTTRSFTLNNLLNLGLFLPNLEGEAPWVESIVQKTVDDQVCVTTETNPAAGSSTALTFEVANTPLSAILFRAIVRSPYDPGDI